MYGLNTCIETIHVLRVSPARGHCECIILCTMSCDASQCSPPKALMVVVVGGGEGGHGLGGGL